MRRRGTQNASASTAARRGRIGNVGLPALLLAVSLGAFRGPGAPADRFSRASDPPAQPTEADAPHPRQRQPVAMALSHDDRWLWVANRRSGTVQLLDLANRRVISELPVGRSLADICWDHARRRLLVVDEQAHQLIQLDVDDTGDPPRATVVKRIEVSPFPVSLQLTKDGRRCLIASLWSRRLTLLDFDQDGAVTNAIRTVDLPFAPRQQLLVDDDQRLLVADSFAGRIAIIDSREGGIEAVRTIPAHNIRGLAATPDGSMLLVAHQMLNDYAHADRNDIHWGLMMSNDLRWIRLDRFLDGRGNLFEGGHMHPLGHAGDGTADPAGLAVAADGRVVVTLGGVGEIATGSEQDFGLARLTVARRPTAVLVTRDSGRAVVANTFDDAISVVDLNERKLVAQIELGVAPELSAEERGERLFYDARLAHDGWMSCHSCHTDGHANGQLNDNFSDGSFGSAKRVLSLLGCSDTAPYAWNGSMPDLPAQIRSSVTRTMQNESGPTEEQVSDLTAYLRSLNPPPSVDALRGTLDPVKVEVGQRLFQELGCIECHRPPSYSCEATHDVGLSDKRGNKLYNPPSLRGVGQRDLLFHDNRAAGPRAVLETFKHQLERDLAAEELDALTAFLRSL
jgi:DNA-binding beta-propeller fold protein YncE